VAGLGFSPNDVVINGSIDVYNQCDTSGSCVALRKGFLSHGPIDFLKEPWQGSNRSIVVRSSESLRDLKMAVRNPKNASALARFLHQMVVLC